MLVQFIHGLCQNHWHPCPQGFKRKRSLKKRGVCVRRKRGSNRERETERERQRETDTHITHITQTQTHNHTLWPRKVERWWKGLLHGCSLSLFGNGLLSKSGTLCFAGIIANRRQSQSVTTSRHRLSTRKRRGDHLRHLPSIVNLWSQQFVLFVTAVTRARHTDVYFRAAFVLFSVLFLPLCCSHTTFACVFFSSCLLACLLGVVLLLLCCFFLLWSCCQLRQQTTN